MTKGIREYVNARFVKLLPKLAELGNAGFRRKVMEDTVAKFEISVASAATHYNHAFKVTKLADPASVEGLGRADDKKGGRPPLTVVNVVNARSGKVVAEGVSQGKARDLIAAAGVLKSGDPKLAIAA
jgi:hypothetical protein